MPFLTMKPLKSARILTLKLPLLLCDSCKKRATVKSIISDWKAIDGFAAASGEQPINRRSVRLTFIKVLDAFPPSVELL